MPRINTAFFDISAIDLLARQNTPVHRIDPRAKLITTFTYILFVISFEKYQVSTLLPFLLFPVIMASLGNIPFDFLLKKIIIVAPFALMIGIFNPFFDREAMVRIGTLSLSGGWISFLSILIRSLLTISAALILIATTGFREVCLAMEKLQAPRVFAVQLLFLYRYIFVLIEETSRMIRARQLRSFGKRGLGWQTAGFMIGHLLIRTINRARRIHQAMLCRGFDGEIRIIRKLNFTAVDFFFLLFWIFVFMILRFNNIPAYLGNLISL